MAALKRKNPLSPEERLCQEAWDQGPAVERVDLDASGQNLIFLLKTGATLTVPVASLPELEGATPAQLADVDVAPDGSRVSWFELDVDYDASGTIMDLIAGKSWRRAMRRAMAREVGSVTSEAKAAASRENGKRGGRPRKAVAESAPQMTVRQARTNEA